MSEIKDLYNALLVLQNTSSRIAKEDLLRQYNGNETFKCVLKFLLNPRIVTGISHKKLNKVLSNDVQLPSVLSVCDLLSYFDTHHTGSDADVAYVKAYMNRLCADYDDVEWLALMDMLSAIITRTLRIGVNLPTARKIYGKDFVKTLDVMLGTSIENCTIPEDARIFISRKLNGTRCFYYRGHLYSRQGKEFTGLEHIIKDIEWLFPVKDLVVDGELLLQDDNLTDSENFQKGTGIATSKDKDKSVLKLVIFDVLPVEEFDKGISAANYSVRKESLKYIENYIKAEHLKNVSIVPFVYEGYDHSEIWKALDYAEEHDWEGVMVNLDTPYVAKRTPNLIKVKKFYTYDLRVIGVEPGTGRNKNRLGNVVVDYKGNNVRVGSGFSDEQRELYWKHPELIIGRVIEVKYKEKTRNLGGTESLQFPVFIQVREEGKEPSVD